ncbi:MAG: nicotinamide mononucleotide transporter [Armatimonadota bacterium]
MTYLLAIASLIGTVANVYKLRWCFAIWLITNTLWCIHNAHIGQYAQSGLNAVYAGLAAWGLWQWRRPKPS